MFLWDARYQFTLEAMGMTARGCFIRKILMKTQIDAFTLSRPTRKKLVVMRMYVHQFPIVCSNLRIKTGNNKKKTNDKNPVQTRNAVRTSGTLGANWDSGLKTKETPRLRVSNTAISPCPISPRKSQFNVLDERRKTNNCQFTRTSSRV